jgi:hypothetical protein
VLQMITRPALTKLESFNNHPCKDHASALIDIPVLYDLLQYEESMYRRYSPSILAMCRWMYMGGNAILKALIVHDLPPKDFHEEPISWTKVPFIVIS